MTRLVRRRRRRSAGPGGHRAVAVHRSAAASDDRGDPPILLATGFPNEANGMPTICMTDHAELAVWTLDNHTFDPVERNKLLTEEVVPRVSTLPGRAERDHGNIAVA